MMKTIRYIVLGMVIMIFSFGSLTGLLAQKTTIQFLETYPCSEIFSRLGSEDAFYQMAEVNRQDPGSAIIAYCNPDNADRVWKYIHSSTFMNKLPGDLQFAWGAESMEEGLPLYLLRQPDNRGAGPGGADVDQVEVVSDPGNGRYSLLLSFNRTGAEAWSRMTGDNVGRDIAIVINDRVWSAPRVQEQINMGKCMITGNFSKKEVNELKEQIDQQP